VTFATGVESTDAQPSSDYNDANGDTSVSCTSEECVGVGQFENAAGEYAAFEVAIALNASSSTPTTTTTTTTTTVPTSIPRPATVTIAFAANSSRLTAKAKDALIAVAKKLVAGADVTVTGYARRDASLAKERATTVATELSRRVKLRITLRYVTNEVGNKVTVATSKN
jgi:outer membrane protein OmpA-like peptidoglycan-associated protein